MAGFGLLVGGICLLALAELPSESAAGAAWPGLPPGGGGGLTLRASLRAGEVAIEQRAASGAAASAAGADAVSLWHAAAFRHCRPGPPRVYVISMNHIPLPSFMMWPPSLLGGGLSWCVSLRLCRCRSRCRRRSSRSAGSARWRSSEFPAELADLMTDLEYPRARYTFVGPGTSKGADPVREGEQGVSQSSPHRYRHVAPGCRIRHHAGWWQRCRLGLPQRQSQVPMAGPYGCAFMWRFLRGR